MNIRRKLSKIVSGGQTGVDRAALDVALKYKIPCGGWCPKGRIAEDGIIPERYPLKETESLDYTVRTELNVRDFDGTLVLNRGELSGGTAFTVEFAKKHRKHCLIVDLKKKRKNAIYDVVKWIEANDIKVLNVAGPRESKSPGIYKVAKKFLEELMEELSP